MSIFSNTLTEICKICLDNSIKFTVTRCDRSGKVAPADIDLLVLPIDYQKIILAAKKLGYSTSSHDGALGGRIKGMQINLVKPQRTKVDLHQDFTWRSTRYMDVNLIWKNLEQVRIDGVECPMPRKNIDAFIILINIIFEKTYITLEDFNCIKDQLLKVLNDPVMADESRKYGWHKTFILFKRWFTSVKVSQFPLFLPSYIILFSYLEKLIHEKKINIVSLLYYVFFRTRFIINRRLPYE